MHVGVVNKVNVNITQSAYSTNNRFLSNAMGSVGPSVENKFDQYSIPLPTYL